MRLFAAATSAVLSFVGCSSTAAGTHSPQALRAAGAPVIDVRTPEEWNEGHADGTVLIPVQELEARLAEVDALVGGDKSRPVVVVCRSGARAGRAAAILKARGYSTVVNGGAWTTMR